MKQRNSFLPLSSTYTFIFLLVLISFPPILVSSPKSKFNFDTSFASHIIPGGMFGSGIIASSNPHFSTDSTVHLEGRASLNNGHHLGILFLPVIPEVVPTVSVDYILPRKLTCPLNNDVWKNIFLLKWSLFRWWVTFQEGTYLFFVRFLLDPHWTIMAMETAMETPKRPVTFRGA